VNSPEKHPRIAICGARGIGQVHTRIFHSYGAKICSILGSSDRSAHEAAQTLKNSFGITAIPFSCLDTLLKETEPNALVICTPPHLHFREIIAAFNRNIPVFCEKPLFWHNNITAVEIEKKLCTLNSYSNKKLFVNTCNASFLDQILTLIGEQGKINSFFFRFHTHGPHLDRDIAVDLLPHGISFLLRLFGVMKIQDIIEHTDRNKWRCTFRYGHCLVKFDFQESSSKAKSLAFAISGREFARIQKGVGNSYRVYLKDSLTGKMLQAKDPFQVYISQFLDYCKDTSSSWEQLFFEASTNLRLMSNIIFP